MLHPKRAEAMLHPKRAEAVGLLPDVLQLPIAESTNSQPLPRSIVCQQPPVWQTYCCDRRHAALLAALPYVTKSAYRVGWGLDCWGHGLLQHWTAGVMDCCNIGLLGSWIAATLDCWGHGLLQQQNHHTATAAIHTRACRKQSNLAGLL
jgi:hypothetical protein